MQAIVAFDDQLGLVLGRMWSDLPKHLAVSLPLAWRGMMQAWQIWYGNALWLLVIFSFVQGSGRNRRRPGGAGVLPLFVLAVNALVSVSLPRYGVGLLMPLSVGVALPVAWIVEVRGAGCGAGDPRWSPTGGRTIRSLPQRAAAILRADARTNELHDRLRVGSDETGPRRPVTFPSTPFFGLEFRDSKYLESGDGFPLSRE